MDPVTACKVEVPMSPAEIITALRALLAALPEDHAVVDQTGLSSKRRADLRELIAKAIERLEALRIGLDPIRLPPVMFDPSNPDVVGRLIGETLIEQNRAPLDGLPKFYGSGVYSLYYNGKFPAYVPASGTDTPLYVGKADPAFSDARSPVEQGVKLWGTAPESTRRAFAVRRPRYRRIRVPLSRGQKCVAGDSRTLSD